MKTKNKQKSRDSSCDPALSVHDNVSHHQDNTRDQHVNLIWSQLVAMVLRAQWPLGTIAQFFHFVAEEKSKTKKTKVFYDWATTGIPVKILSTRSPKLRLLCRLSKSLVFGWYQTEGVLILFHTRILEKFTLHVYKGKTSPFLCTRFLEKLEVSTKWKMKFTGHVYFRRPVTPYTGSWIYESRSPFCKIHASHTYFGLNHASSVNPLAPSFSKSVWQLSYDTAIKYRNIKYD